MSKYHKYKDRFRRTIRVRYGLCGYCGEPREGVGSTVTRCARCAEAYRVKTQARRAARTKDNLCRECGAPCGEYGTQLYCRPCADKLNAAINAYRAQLRSQGLCRCGLNAPEPGYKMCRACRLVWSAKDRALQARRRAASKQGDKPCRTKQ